MRHSFKGSFRGIIVIAIIYGCFWAVHNVPQLKNIFQNDGSSVATTFHPDSAKVVASNCDWRTGQGCPQIPPPNSCKQALLEDTHCNPGATNPAVTQNTIDQTICHSGYTATIRPPTSY